MKVVIQKCLNGSVVVNQKEVGKINHGLMILVGFTDGDNEDTIAKMARKVVNLRIFEDENDVMNKSILDIKGSILSVSQFTLYADTAKGNRPSYIKAMKSENATKLYDKWNGELRQYVPVETGIFGANMQVTFTNDGPTTIIIEM